MLSNGKENSIGHIKSNEEVIPSIIQYIDSHNLDGAEILLPSKEEEFVSDACETISHYLEKNDNSIGLLSDNKDYLKDYFSILYAYGVTFAFLGNVLAKPLPKSEKPYLPDNENEGEEKELGRPKLRFTLSQMCEIAPEPKRRPKPDKTDLVLEESFNTRLIRLLIESGKTNVEVYEDGGISRQVFSKVISTKDMIPKKDTVICLIIGMELNYTDATLLLESAGYALSKSIVFDAVVMKYLKREQFDLRVINNELEERNCPLLGWKPR